MIRNASLALITALTLGAPAAAFADTAAPSTAPVASQVETVPAHAVVATPSTQTAPLANSDDAQRYSQRDAQHQADKFTGGSVVIIGASGGAILVVLLILLILL